MSKLTKILVSTAAVGVVVGVTYVVVKKSNERKYISTDEFEDSEVEEDPTLVDKIKIAATEKAAKILSWAVVNQEKLEAFSTGVGLVAGLFSLYSAIKDLKVKNDTIKKLDELLADRVLFQDSWNRTIKSYDADCYKVIDKLNAIEAALTTKKK